MAWTAPRTWVTGAVITDAQLNAHVRDNFLETAPAKITTAGDLVQGTGANALARLAAVAVGNVLLSGGVGTASAWGKVADAHITSGGLTPNKITRKWASVYKNASTTVPTGTASPTPVDFNQEEVDTDGWHSTGTNPSRITPLTSGLAIGVAFMTWDAPSATGQRIMLMRKNAGTSSDQQHIDSKMGTTAFSLRQTMAFAHAVNGSTDYIEVLASQDSGGDMAITSGAFKLAVVQA